MKRIIPLILSILIIFTVFLPVFATSDSLIINFKIGSSKVLINNKQKNIEKPFTLNKSIYVPLKDFLEAYGAEVDLKVKGKVKLIYRDVEISFTIGNKNYIVNEISKSFTGIPKSVHNTLMAPVDFITNNFGGKLSYNKKDSTYTLVLEDDGAISDFSAVIGSINKAKVGNSYFGWSIAIPKGSQILDNAFNSKDVSIGNEQRGIVIDINVSIDEGKKYQDFINEMKDMSDDSFYDSSNTGKILDSSINTNTSLKYAEVLTSDYMRGGIIRRIFINNGYVYKYTLSSTKEVNPKKLKNDAYFMNLLNSFRLGYKGNVADVRDISKVKEGMVKYTDTIYGFTFSVPPEWEILGSDESTDIPAIKVGLNNKEYIKISAEFIEGITNIDIYGDTMINNYSVDYNSKLYNFIEKKSLELINTKACKLVYSLDFKGKKSVFDENLLIKDDINYDITIKSPENIYSKKKELYSKILSSINNSTKYADSIKKYLEASKTDAVMSRVAKDDGPVDFIQKDYKWKMKIPGYWLTSSYTSENIKMFSDVKSQIYLGIESVVNNSDTLKQDSKTVFDTLKSIQDGKDNYKFISREVITDKGTSIQVYKYRLEDVKTDTYADAIYYIINGDKYSYCFFYVLQDIYASEKKVKEIENIWNSFMFNYVN